MKISYPLIIVFFLIAGGVTYLTIDSFSNQNRQDDERQMKDFLIENPLKKTFNFNGKSLVWIHNQTNDTIQLATYYDSAVLYEDYREKAVVPPLGKIKKELRTEGVKYLTLTIQGSAYQVITSPDAEVIVQINQTPDGFRLEFAGEHTTINEFLQKEARHFGYHSDEKLIHYKALTNEKNFAKLIGIVDSITNLHQTFLQNAVDDLPKWYVSYEGQRLNYERVQTKLNDLMYRKILLNIDDEVGDSFLKKTVTLPLNNTELLSSWDYHAYLNNYFFIKNDPALAGFPKELDKQKISFSRRLELESKELKGIARDVYLTRQLTYEINKYRYLVDSSMLAYVKDSTLNAHLKSLYASSDVLPRGSKIPYFYLKDIEGNFLTPDDFSGKVLLINFWSVGCKPCIKEIPEENLLVKDYKDKPVAIVNICMNSSEKLWRKISKKHKIKAINLFAQGNWSDKVSKDFDVSGWPHSILIDNDGKVIANHTLRASAIRPMIDDLLLNMK
jgi:thiol-disulfide isomerase/thioredoxin